MPIPVQCVCGRKLKAPDEFAGTRAECPSCGLPLTIPVPVATEAAVAASDSSPAGAAQSRAEQFAIPQSGLHSASPDAHAGADDIREFLDPPSSTKPPPPLPQKSISLRLMFEALLDPRSIQWMLTLGGGLLVLGIVIWLVSLGIFKDPTILAIAMGIGTAALMGGGWWLTLKSRFHMAGQALTFLACVVAPLNLWFYHAQGLITLDNHLWVGGLVCCLIYIATVYVLRDPLFMYAFEAGLTLTALLLLADLQWLNDTTFLSTFLTAIGLFSIHAERAFSPREEEHFNRPRFGMPLFWSGHVQMAAALLILLGTQMCGWLFSPGRSLFGYSWPGNTLSHSSLIAGALWLVGTYAYLYSDLVVRRNGIFTYISAFCLLIAEVTIVGDQLQTEGVIAVLAVTALAANLLRSTLQQSSERLNRTILPLALGMSALPVLMGISLHLRATSQLAGQMLQPYATGWPFVIAMLVVAACNRVSAYLFRNEDSKTSAAYFFLSAGSLIVAAAGLLRQFELVIWAQQAPLLMLIPIGYLVASRLWMGQSPERPLVWIAHTATAVILAHGLLATIDTLGTVIQPVQGHLDNLLLGIVFAEAAVFYMLAGLFRKRSSNVYFASAAACAALWQFIGYWGQLDQAYYTMLYAVVGIVLMGVSRVVGLETVEVYTPDGHKNPRLRGRGLSLFQSGNAILIVALLAALLQGLAQLVTQQATTLTLTALLLTTAVSFVAIATAPAGNWRRLYWSSSIILSALCFLTFNVLINLTIWQKLEIFCVVLGIVLIVASYIGRFLEIQSVSDDSVTMGLSLGSLLVAVPLISSVCYYRFHVGAVHWPEELAIVILTIMMLVTGFSWKVKSTTLVGGGALFLYLLIIIGQLAYQPQVATGVYLAIGGGLVFLMGVCLSMYRDVLLQLPDRIARREGVFQIIGWR